MKRFDLSVEERQTGKHNSRQSRNGKKIPAVVYGSVDNKNVLVDENTLIKYNTRAYENALYSLKSSDNKLNGVVVLMKDIQIHPVTRRPLHADLFALNMNKPVRVSVEVRFDGKPAGLAEGGLLNVVNRQVEIECLPTAIPENFVMDISDLGVGDAKHVSDLKLPSGIKLITSADQTLAVCNLFVEEVVEAAPTAEAAAGTTAPAAGAAAPAAGGAAAPAGTAAAPAAGAKDAKAAPAKEKK